MTEIEFEIIDELYFVTSYEELSKELDHLNEGLAAELMDLHQKGWIRVFDDPDGQADSELITIESLQKSYLLASKAGLKEHNS